MTPTQQLPTCLQAGPKREVLLYGAALLCSDHGADLPLASLLQSKAVSGWFRKQPGLLPHSQEEQANALYRALIAPCGNAGETTTHPYALILVMYHSCAIGKQLLWQCHIHDKTATQQVLINSPSSTRDRLWLHLSLIACSIG